MRVYLHKLFYVDWKVLTSLLLSSALTACGGGDEVEGGLPGFSNNPPATVRISYPNTDAIQVVGGGVYRRNGSVLVTDSEGNAVADGTRVKLIVIDSIKAYGTIDAGDSISGSTITDTAPLLGDFITPTTLDGAYADRGGAKFIDDSDHVLMFNTFAVDRARQVAGRTVSNPTNTTVNVTAPYAAPYPNTPYDGVAFITEYIIGSSLLGASIAGAGGTVGYTTTTGGVATFDVTYPADVNHIRTGCALPTGVVDDRYLPVDSSHTFVYAEVDGFEHVNTIDSSLVGGFPEKTGFCFSQVRAGEIIASQTNATTVEGVCLDGGDGVEVPFVQVGVSSSDPAVNATAAVTNRYGGFISTLSGAGSATLTYSCNGGATGTVDVTTP